MIRRGDVFFSKIGKGVGSEQHGDRPVVVIQNDIGNLHSPTTIVAMITSKQKSRLPTHVSLHGNNIGLTDESVVMLEQIRTLDKRRLKERMGHLEDNVMQKVNNALYVSFGLSPVSQTDTERDETAEDQPQTKETAHTEATATNNAG